MNISLRIDDETMARLDKAAQSLDRPRSWVAMEALEQFLSYHEWFTKSVEKAVATAESGGPFVSHDDVVAKSKARSKERAK
jgi:predicted transcriptional regulator